GDGSSGSPTPATGEGDLASLVRDRRERRDQQRREHFGPTLSSVSLSLPGQLSSQQLEDGEKPFIGVASDSDRKGFIDRDGTSVYSEWEFVAKQPKAPAGVPPGTPGGAPGARAAGIPPGTPGG